MISTIAALSPNLFPPPVLDSAILSTCIHLWATLVGLDSAILSPSAWDFYFIGEQDEACGGGGIRPAILSLPKWRTCQCFVYGRNCKTDFPLGDKLRRGARSRWSEGDLPLICLPPPPTPKIKALINGISLFLFLQIPLPLLHPHQILIG